MPGVESPAIELRKVSFRYGATEVLSEVSLNVNQGEYLGLVGPNGGGKTTLAKLCLGLLTPSSGTIKLFGTPLHEFHDWQRIGYVPQRPNELLNAFPATVREVVLMGRIAQHGLAGGLTKSDHLHADAALKTVGLTKLAHRRIGDLSGGQQQRVFIARALAGQPDLIVLDEPTVGVEAGVRDTFYDLLRVLHRDNHHTLILISHDLTCVEREASRMIEVNRTLGVHRHHGPRHD